MQEWLYDHSEELLYYGFPAALGLFLGSCLLKWLWERLFPTRAARYRAAPLERAAGWMVLPVRKVMRDYLLAIAFNLAIAGVGVAMLAAGSFKLGLQGFLLVVGGLFHGWVYVRLFRHFLADRAKAAKKT